MNFSKILLLFLVTTTLSFYYTNDKVSNSSNGRKIISVKPTYKHPKKTSNKNTQYPGYQLIYVPPKVYYYPPVFQKSQQPCNISKPNDLKKILKYQSTADSFKANISRIIAQITEFKTSEGTQLTQKLTNNLHQIYLILQQKHHGQNNGFNQLLQNRLRVAVKTFLQTTDKIQQYLQKKVPVLVRGDHNNITGKNTVNGQKNKIQGTSNAAFGHSNSIAGDSGIAKGNDNIVIGNDAFIVGHNNTAKGNNTYIFSFNKNTDKSDHLLIGDFVVNLKKFQ